MRQLQEMQGQRSTSGQATGHLRQLCCKGQGGGTIGSREAGSQSSSQGRQRVGPTRENGAAERGKRCPEEEIGSLQAQLEEVRSEKGAVHCKDHY